MTATPKIDALNSDPADPLGEEEMEAAEAIREALEEARAEAGIDLAWDRAHGLWD